MRTYVLMVVTSIVNTDPVRTAVLRHLQVDLNREQLSTRESSSSTY